MHITTTSLLFNDTFFRCKISINIQCLNWHTGTKKLQNSQTYSLKKCIQGGQNLPKKINIHVPQFETLEYVSSTFFLKKRGGFENKGEMKSFYHQKWRIFYLQYIIVFIQKTFLMIVDAVMIYHENMVAKIDSNPLYSKFQIILYLLIYSIVT